jgi:hypothetical protein
MKQVYRAEDEPVLARRLLAAVVARTAVPTDLRPEDPAFWSRVVTGALGAATVTDVTDGPGEAIRTALHVRRSPMDMYQLFVQVRGQTVAEPWALSNRSCDQSGP